MHAAIAFLYTGGVIKDNQKLPGRTPEPFFQAASTLAVATKGAGLTDITGKVTDWLREMQARDGLLTLFIGHTSASLTIQENADPAVQVDLLRALARFAPENADYMHADEGPDDMPAHIKAMLTSVSLSIPVVGGKAALGVWQAVYVIEHRARPHRRRISLHYIGNRAEGQT